jgi:hypothetical protein
LTLAFFDSYLKGNEHSLDALERSGSEIAVRHYLAVILVGYIASSVFSGKEPIHTGVAEAD